MKLVILKPDFTKRLHKALENTMIDWQRVNELENEVGTEDFSEIARLFLEEVDEVIARLKQSPPSNTLEEEFHFLKGSALNLGFQDFSILCATAEKQAANGDHGSIDINGAIECYELSCVTFHQTRSVGNAA